MDNKKLTYLKKMEAMKQDREIVKNAKKALSSLRILPSMTTGRKIINKKSR